MTLTFPVILFAVLAGITGGSALMVVFTQHIVRAAVWLLFTLVGVAGLYFLLGADFLGAAQLIIYVGGTLVLVVFGVMLTAQEGLLRLQAALWERLAALVVGGALLLVIVLALHRPWVSTPPKPDESMKTVADLGAALLGAGSPGYLLPFEAVSVHLLVVLIGAAYLARARRRKPLPIIAPETPSEGRA